VHSSSTRCYLDVLKVFSGPKAGIYFTVEPSFLAYGRSLFMIDMHAVVVVVVVEVVLIVSVVVVVIVVVEVVVADVVVVVVEVIVVVVV